MDAKKILLSEMTTLILQSSFLVICNSEELAQICTAGRKQGFSLLDQPMFKENFFSRKIVLTKRDYIMAELKLPVSLT